MLVFEWANYHSLPQPNVLARSHTCSQVDFLSLAGLNDVQCRYLRFLEALVVRFLRLWNPGIQPRTSEAASIMATSSFKRKKICQFLHCLDRSSLLCARAVLVPWHNGDLDTRSAIISVIANVTLGSSATAATFAIEL